MTGADLITIALNNYFSDEETDEARRIAKSQGPGAAVAFLKARCSVRSVSGADFSIHTFDGKVVMRCLPFGDPEKVMSLADFCRMKVELFSQLRLL